MLVIFTACYFYKPYMSTNLNNELATKPHYPILDGLRGVAAIIVVTFHLTEPLGTGHLDILVNHGYLAVDFSFYYRVL